MMLSLLCDQGAGARSKTNDGQTAYDIAVKAGYVELADQLAQRAMHGNVMMVLWMMY